MGAFHETIRLILSAGNRQRLLCAATVMALAAGVFLTAQTPAAQPAANTTVRHARRHTPKPATRETAVKAPEAPPAPEMPKWPLDSAPAPARVTWDSHGLSINATNSSLIQILHDYAVATGTKVEGVSNDERIFGVYGPGSARDVLNQVLTGSGYNVLMIGDLGQGAPRELVLSSRNPNSGQKQSTARPMSEPQEDDAVENDAEEPEPPPQPVIQPQVIQPNMPPGTQPPTPQQLMEQMQQRQQQMQQQQQQENPQL
jgi:hypothetical protein